MFKTLKRGSFCATIRLLKTQRSVNNVFGKSSTKRSVLGQDVVSDEGIYRKRTEDRKRAMPFQESLLRRIGPGLVFLLGGVLIWIVLGILFYMTIALLNNPLQMFNESTNLFRTIGVPYIHSGLISTYLHFGTKWWYLGLSFLTSGIAAFYLAMLRKRYDTALDSSDINDYVGDSRLLTLEEMVAKYPAAPNRGAHFDGEVSAIVGHMVIDNQGIEKQMLPVLEVVGDKPYEEFGSRVRPVYQVNKKTGERRVKREMQKLMDPDEGVRTLNAVGVYGKEFTTPQNPKKLITKRKKGETLAEYINEHWWVPDYETEKPTGVYFYDDAPVNVMVVAMTRGNKGQNIVNPTLDLWTRQEKLPNIFVNDPKGELYTAFYSTLKMRGYETVVFNLLDSDFTDQFNPISQVIGYVRKGYTKEPQSLLTSLADNFFPMPEGSDPIWTQGERMIFNILAFLLLDFYFEEEQEYLEANAGKLDESIIQRDLDELWENVTLPNVYRMVTAYATRKYREIDMKTGAYGAETDVNMLDKLFEITSKLPSSNIRRLFRNPYSNLMSMAESEKMRSSMYGMALTDMSFFIEAPIIALTACSPKQSFDLASMSFPRRFQFNFNVDLTADRGWIGQRVRFELYRDKYFKDKYEGKEYEHATRIDKLSWVEMRFEAILDQPITYVKMIIEPRSSDSGIVYGEYYAEFEKGMLMDPTRTNFVIDPITEDFQVKDGVVRMGVLDETGAFTRDEVPQETLSHGEVVNVITLTEVAYNEKPFAVFSVTPPSALTYVKIILMLIHMMFNSSVENSYMTKDNGKPLNKTMYMLDEAGNLSYQGAGIDSLTTKMSIGLAQGQQFTLILQTLQQITDIYGEKRDRIISSNTGVTIYLLSSDLEMLRTMSEQAGKHHRSRFNNKNFSIGVGTGVDLIDDTISYGRTIQEEPLITVGELLQMTRGEALILSTTKRDDNEGTNVRQQPIMNTGETSLPMSYYLHRHGYMQRSFSMLTVPTANETVNQIEKVPPFETLFKKRLRQSHIAPRVMESYMKKHGYTEMQLSNNPHLEDKASKDIMRQINKMIYYGELTGWDFSKLKEVLAKQGQEKSTSEFTDIFGKDGKGFSEAGDAIRSEEFQVDHTMHEDEDTKRGASVRAKAAYEEDLLQYGEGHFSRSNMRLGQFKGNLAKALIDIDVSEVNEPFVFKVDGERDVLMYNNYEVAYSEYVSQEQEAQTEDGTTQGAGETIGKSWTVRDEFITALTQVEDWRAALGTSFMDTLLREFKGRDTRTEMADMTAY